MTKQIKTFITLAILTIISIISISVVFAQEETNTIEKIDGFPVVLDNETLFVIQAEVGSFSPEERASTISERIKNIAIDESISTDLFMIEKQENNTNIILNNKLIVTITDKDAQFARTSGDILANQYLQKIQNSINEYRENRNPKQILFAFIYSLIATVVSILLFVILNIIFPKIYHQINEGQIIQIQGIRIQNSVIFTSAQIKRMIIALARIIRWIINVAILYIYFPLVLSFFPWTKQLSRDIFSQVVETISNAWNGFIEYLPNLIIVVLTSIFSFYFIKFLKLIFTELSNGNISLPGFYPEWANPTYKLLQFMTISFTAVIVFPYLPGFDSPAFQGVSIFLGVLVSLGSTAAVANIVAGIILIYTRAFEEGDRVKISETIGDVIEKSLLVTRIRTQKNVIITIPNAMVLNSHMVNYSASVLESQTPLIIFITITLGYDVPWRKVHQVLIEAAKATENVLTQPAPFVLQTSLNDFYVSYELNIYTYKSNLISVIQSELHQNLQDKCNEAGIEILSPHYSAIRDGHQTTIPSEYLAKDYTSPGFRFESPLDFLNPPDHNHNHNHKS